VDAFEAVIREKTRATRDLGGTSGTSQFADAIIARLG
jgi:isocitrate/isopropylmalate dehydrogenase